MVLPFTTDAAAVSVFVFATVVVKVPKLPVKVTSSDTAAVCVPLFVMVERFAAAVASSAVTATLPSPLMVLPFTTECCRRQRLRIRNSRCEGVPLPVKVTSSDTAAVCVPLFVMVERFAAAVASSAVTATLPAPLMV